VVKGTFLDFDEPPPSESIRRSKTDSVLEVKEPESEDSYEPGAFADAVADMTLSCCSSPVHSSLKTEEHQENKPVTMLQPVFIQTLLPVVTFVSYLPVSPDASSQQQQFPISPVASPQQHPHVKQQDCTEQRHCSEQQHWPDGNWQRSKEAEPEPKQQMTTVMLRNLPNNYTRKMLLDLLDDHGFSGYYDFLYLPMDFNRKANLGYAFVNLVDPEAAEAFWDVFDGFAKWALPTAKVCEVSWSGPIQGFKAHVDRYKNSPVMHQSVPDEYKPMIFAAGVPQPFPPASKKVRPPQKH